MTDTRDVIIVLMTDVCLRWMMRNNELGNETVGQMADRFISLLDQHGYEIVPKKVT
jgi:hypothetical protein